MSSCINLIRPISASETTRWRNAAVRTEECIFLWSDMVTNHEWLYLSCSKSRIRVALFVPYIQETAEARSTSARRSGLNKPYLTLRSLSLDKPSSHAHECCTEVSTCWIMPSSGMLRRVPLVRTDVTEERIASVIKGDNNRRARSSVWSN
jgi:hypothetical protein